MPTYQKLSTINAKIYETGGLKIVILLELMLNGPTLVILLGWEIDILIIF